MIQQSASAIQEGVDILGIRLSTRTMDATVAAIDDLLATGHPHLIVTADASGLALAQNDLELAEIYHSAAIATADSFGVVWAMRRKGVQAERVSGVDLMDRLCHLSAVKGYRIYLLGAGPGVAEEAAERLQLRHPGCHIVGTKNGYFPASDDEIVAEEVAKAKPDILFVALGIPRQEKFISKTRAIIRSKIAMGVGGSLDVFSGRVKRAPAFIQRLKLEWLWRTLLNPRKFSKAMQLPRFAWMVLRAGK